MTDLVALGVYHGLNEAGLRIPQDVSVIGFDNTYLAEFSSPAMCTVDISRKSMCEAAVGMLLEEATSGKSGREFKLSTNLIVRNSTAPPSNRKMPRKSVLNAKKS
jgi:LacI family transcriptional regulator